MKQKTARYLLRMLGWKTVSGPVPVKKCIILGAPHTSVWDFVISYLFYAAVGGSAKVMVKKGFFKWPLGPVLKKLGAIPVERTAGGSATLVRHIISEFEKTDDLQLAIAPEGTRRPVKKWKSGFHTMARAAKVPVYLGFFDWGTKTVGADMNEFILTDDVHADMKRLRQWYKDKGVVGKFPEKFVTGDDLD